VLQAAKVTAVLQAAKVTAVLQAAKVTAVLQSAGLRSRTHKESELFGWSRIPKNTGVGVIVRFLPPTPDPIESF